MRAGWWILLAAVTLIAGGAVVYFFVPRNLKIHDAEGDDDFAVKY